MSPPHAPAGPASREEPFLVRCYDQKASKAGKGVQAARFATAEEAEAFAAGKRLYLKPAVVEVRS
jgi:hypothetical protein